MLKRLIIVAIVMLAVGFASMVLAPFQERIVHSWLSWCYPPSTPTSQGPMGRQILGDLQGQRSKDALRECVRVQALLEEARAQGLDVSNLEPSMALALKWANEGKSEEAFLLINSVEMRISRKPQVVAEIKPAVAKAKERLKRVRRRS